ncbi:MAG: response regulator [Candidatus Brocadiales bacterium]
MKKILVIEDTEDNMYLVCYILRNNGYKTIEARTGEEGVRLARKESPNLILVDIHLPDIDGFEVIRRIRESEINGEIPIVALTSYAMIGDREKTLKAGCTGYIEKPINPETFMGEVEKYL